MGGFVALVLVFCFVFLYLRRRRSRVTRALNSPYMSQPTLSSTIADDRSPPIDPFPPPFPAISTSSPTVCYHSANYSVPSAHFHSSKLRNEIQHQPSIPSTYTQTQTTSQPAVSSTSSQSRTRPSGRTTDTSGSGQPESIETLMYRLNRALANLPAQEGSSSSSNAPPQYDQL